MGKEETEVWKPVTLFEGCYEVSNTGKIKTVARSFIQKNGQVKRIKELIKVCPQNHRGYNRAQLTSSTGFKKIYSVHRIVAHHFIPNPNNLQEVNHINGIKTDNRVENLEWCDRKHNEFHAKLNGLKSRGTKNPRSKIDDIQAKTIKSLKGEVKIAALAGYFNVSKATISSINSNRNWYWV